MEFMLEKVGVVNKSTIRLDGLTIICGTNNSGKSTAGKALYTTIESLSNLKEKLHKELLMNYRRVTMLVSRVLDLASIAKYVDFPKIQKDKNKNFDVLLNDNIYDFHIDPQMENVVGSFIDLKNTIEFLNQDLLLEYAVKSKSRTLQMYLKNFDDNKRKALSFIDKLNKYFDNEDILDFAEQNVAKLSYKEFNGQVFPINLKTNDRKSIFAISKNGEEGCRFVVTDGKNISAVVNSSKLFLNNAIYIDDPFALDKLKRNDEYWFPQMFEEVSLTHTEKLLRILLKKRSSSSIIEDSINQENYAKIVNKISEIIPGSLSLKEGVIFYEEANKEPLRVENLATGSKMFSIIKNLLEKGEINFDTMLILDEPEAHLHPEWQNIFAEIIVLIVKEFNTHILLTTHSPNFLMAIEAFVRKYNLEEKSNYYMVKRRDDGYMVDYECVNGNVSQIYSAFTKPLVEAKQIKEGL